jgi:pimeloyl-ACP methyl ester carboxylesterase
VFADVELCSIHLPALGDPDDGILRGPIEDLRARVASEIAAHCDLPFGFYGHSIGGWIALEVAAELRAQTGLAPGFVCLGAVPSVEMLAALLPHDAPSPEAITDEAVQHALRALGLSEHAGAIDDTSGGGGPRSIARGARRDLWLGKQAGFGQARQAHALRGLPSPILLVRASGDPLATVDRAALERLGLSVAESLELTGGHLFLLDPAATRELVERALSPRIDFMLS